MLEGIDISIVLAMMGGLILIVALLLGQSQCATSQEKRRYGEIFQQVSEGVFTIRVAAPNRFFIAEMNPAAAAMLPFGQQNTELAVIADGQAGEGQIFLHDFLEVLQRVVEVGDAVEYETSYLRKADNRRVISCIHLIPMREGRKVRHIAGFIRDVSARQLSACRLAVAPEDFCVLVERSPDTIARHDRAGNLAYANPAFKLLACSSSRAGPAGTTYEYPGAAYREKIREVLESGLEDEIECTWFGPTGRSITSHIRFVPEWDRAGLVVSVLSFGRDITALKNSEQYLQESRVSLRELSARREMQEARLRKEIAHEMHEDMAQTLSAIRMNIASLYKRIGREQPVVAHQFDTALKGLDRTIGQIREMVSAMHPAVLQMGVTLALEWVADEMLGHTGIKYEVRVTAQDEALEEITTGRVFKIVQLALANVVQHAAAQNVGILFEQNGSDFRLEIRDDGKGFDLNRPRRESLGLVAMEELCNSLGGEVVFLSAPGQGTVVEVCFTGAEASRSLIVDVG